MTCALFKPGPDGWHAEQREDPGVMTLVAVRKSPWCDLGHLEGLSDRIMGKGISVPEDDAHRAMDALKRKIEWNSAGWGCCKTCHPDAEFSRERADAP